ncbi:MAG TPA: thioredoxin [Rugosimonospora sp.]|nr:thioredoxin [Rugosimonospora sp.]
MATQTLTSANFGEVTGREGIVLIDFWAEWCGPCKRFAPVFEQASEKYPDIVFGKVDTDAEVDIATQFNIRSIPTLMAVRDGVIVFEQAGALPGSALEQVINAVQGLDMAEVKAQVAGQSA